MQNALDRLLSSVASMRNQLVKITNDYLAAQEKAVPEGKEAEKLCARVAIDR